MHRLLKKYTLKAATYSYAPQPQPFIQKAHSIANSSSSFPTSPDSPKGYAANTSSKVLVKAKKGQAKKQTQKQNVVQNSIKDAWQIQVGAYHREKLADTMAQRIFDALPSNMRQSAKHIVSIRKGKKRPIYRARIAGLNRHQAEWACEQLQKQSFGCFPIKPT